MRLSFLLPVLSLFAFSVHAAEMPSVVRDTLNEAAAECRSAGGNPKKIEDVAKAIDLNGDSSVDWVLDFGNIECEGALSYFCGSSGCQLYIFVSQGSEYVRVWGQNVRSWRVTKIRNLPGIQFDLHGSACGLSGAERCVKNFVFDGNQLREVK